MDATLLTNPGSFKVKVSSTLQPSSLYASKHMFDDSAETCWNSDQGSPQFILLDFQKAVKISELRITFQGGFVGQECILEMGDSINSLTKLNHHLDTLDINDKQCFPLTEPAEGRVFKITFGSSTDFYGRVTIYSFEVYGCER